MQQKEEKEEVLGKEEKKMVEGEEEDYEDGFEEDKEEGGMEYEDRDALALAQMKKIEDFEKDMEIYDRFYLLAWGI